MCGIIGIIIHSIFPISRTRLEKMLTNVAHRGPDGPGIFRDDSIILGHKRLSIIDLSTGAQPMANEDLSIHVCANGEIFNYKELVPDLKKKGHQFRTTCDIEVILHLSEEYGLDLFRYMEGQFAFALWDAPKRRLVLARDRFGIAPLYYCKHEGCADLLLGNQIYVACVREAQVVPRYGPSIHFLGCPGAEDRIRRSKPTQARPIYGLSVGRIFHLLGCDLSGSGQS